MNGTREDALKRATQYFDSGEFIKGLDRLVAMPTQSQLQDAEPALHDYFTNAIEPQLAACGFTSEILANPHDGAGPLLVATRTEGDSLPTVLIYGHGDVVVGQDDGWHDGLSPWTVTADGDCTIWLIARAGFLPIFERHPEMAVSMLHAVVARLRMADEIISAHRH